MQPAAIGEPTVVDRATGCQHQLKIFNIRLNRCSLPSIPQLNKLHILHRDSRGLGLRACQKAIMNDFLPRGLITQLGRSSSRRLPYELAARNLSSTRKPTQQLGNAFAGPNGLDHGLGHTPRAVMRPGITPSLQAVSQIQLPRTGQRCFVFIKREMNPIGHLRVSFSKPKISRGVIDRIALEDQNGSQAALRHRTDEIRNISRRANRGRINIDV